MWFESEPVSGPQHENGEVAATQVLLVLKILIRCNENVEACRLRRVDECPVLEASPTTLVRRLDAVTSEGAL